MAVEYVEGLVPFVYCDVSIRVHWYPDIPSHSQESIPMHIIHIRTLARFRSLVPVLCLAAGCARRLK
jgi:hypothetical protein